MEAKYQALASELRARIQTGDLAAGSLLPTEQMLCETYQVSRQTVRQALGVLVREHLIEKRQGSGSRVVDRAQMPAAEQRNIAVITTYISDYIFPSILREVEDVLSRNNCATLLSATQNQVSNERMVLERLLSRDIDGVLVEGTKTALPNPNLDLYRKLDECGVPLVFMNGNYPELTDAVSVLDDNFAGGYALVEYLAGKGHTHIAGIFKSDDIQGTERYAGYIAAMRDLGLLTWDKHIFWYHTETKERFLSGAAAEPLLSILPGCTAVVCYNDEIAGFLVNALLAQGTRIPEEMAVVSFDDSRYSELSPVRITSLSHGTKNVGRTAAEILLRLMDGEPCQSCQVPWVLNEKESS